MTQSQVRDYCATIYADEYTRTKCDLERSAGRRSDATRRTIETIAQKEAIKCATIRGIQHFPDIEASVVWRAVYETHVHRKCGINDADIIAKVTSADQSWKKSSGHAFEEMVKMLGTNALHEQGIDIVLQRDLSEMVKHNKISNEPRDLSWLREQFRASTFDLYAITHKEDKSFCFGCIQGKTSIRDRVTRDREPSLKAMQSFFWSTIIVLDGDFLRNPKFIAMVNGGTSEYEVNGWHGMYVFSDKYDQDRIYPTDIDFKNFRQHAIEASHQWLEQRQWFNEHWRATFGRQ